MNISNTRQIESIEAGRRSAAWFVVSHAGADCAVVALSAPELLTPLFVLKSGPTAIEDARNEYNRAADSIVHMAQREEAKRLIELERDRVARLADETFDDETNFREAGGFDPLTARWLGERQPVKP